MAGSDDGSMYFWERNTTNNIRILKGDGSIVNCLQPHPTYCLLASSGIDPVVRLWSPLPQVINFAIVFMHCCGLSEFSYGFRMISVLAYSTNLVFETNTFSIELTAS